MQLTLKKNKNKKKLCLFCTQVHSGYYNTWIKNPECYNPQSKRVKLESWLAFERNANTCITRQEKKMLRWDVRAWWNSPVTSEVRLWLVQVKQLCYFHLCFFCQNHCQWETKERKKKKNPSQQQIVCLTDWNVLCLVWTAHQTDRCMDDCVKAFNGRVKESRLQWFLSMVLKSPVVYGFLFLSLCCALLIALFCTIDTGRLK